MLTRVPPASGPSEGRTVTERRAEVHRTTTETDIALTFSIDGSGNAAGAADPAAVYFVHSYAALPADSALIAATTDYGGPVVAAVARDDIWAVQFPPDKGSRVGLHLLANFIATARQEAGAR